MSYVKKLTISGTAGVLVACLIIASLAISFKQIAVNTSPNFELPPGAPPLGSLTATIIISNFTEPLGVGSEAILTVVITSKCDMSNVVVTIDLVSPSDPPSWPLGISVVEGNLSTWTVNLKANISLIFNAKLKIVEEGYARIWAKALWWYNEWLGYPATDSLWILVQENDIQVSHEPITPPGQMPFLPPINATIGSP